MREGKMHISRCFMKNAIAMYAYPFIPFPHEENLRLVSCFYLVMRNWRFGGASRSCRTRTAAIAVG